MPNEPRLTRAEVEVFQCLLWGWATKEISNYIGTSENTIKNHIHMILGKYNVGSKNELMALFIKDEYKQTKLKGLSANA